MYGVKLMLQEQSRVVQLQERLVGGICLLSLLLYDFATRMNHEPVKKYRLLQKTDIAPYYSVPRAH